MNLPSDPERASQDVREIPLELIDEGPADKQRVERDDEHLQRLATSINRIGVMSPIHLRKEGDRFTTIAGSYRREASRIAGLKTIPAIILDCDDRTAWELSCAENSQRHQLSIVEVAETIRVAHVTLGQNIQTIAAAHGHSTTWVEDRLDLLHWDPLILQALHRHKISKAAAAPLARIDHEGDRRLMLADAIQYGATARATAQWATTWQRQRDAGHSPDLHHITSTDLPPLQRLLCTCWLCLQEHENKIMSYLPTCPICVEGVNRTRDETERAAYALKDSTAAVHSSAETPA